MHLKFEPSVTKYGPNDSGLETFRGSWEGSLAREIIQNSLDACRDPAAPVKVKFELLSLSHEELAFMDQMKTAVTSSLEMWSGEDRQKILQIEGAFGDSYPCLKISDYNTTGLTGDDESGKWSALVKTIGGSDGRSGRGGSFGIGKSAPLVTSDFNTVLYSTFNEDGGKAFQGVTRLASHIDNNGQRTSNQGFIGDEHFNAIREEDKIPFFMIRDEIGTDLLVVGYKNKNNNWSDNLLAAVIYNFWPAIWMDRLEVELDGLKLNKTNLKDVWAGIDENKVSHYENFHAFKLLLDSQLTQSYEEEVENVGLSELKFFADYQQDLPKRIYFCRKQGMLIEAKPIRNVSIPYIGLYVCKSDDGSEELRKMEPPRHDKWDTTLVKGNAGERIKYSINEWIRTKLKTMEQNSFEESVNLTELSDLLPEDDPDDPSGDNDSKGLEDLVTIPTTDEPVFVKVRKNATNDLGRDGDDSWIEEDNLWGGRSGDKPVDSNEENPNPPPGPGNLSAGEGEEQDGPKIYSVKPLEIRMTVNGEETKIIVRDSAGSVGFLKLVEVGSDRKEQPMNFLSVVDEEGTQLRFINGVSEQGYEFSENAKIFNLKLGRFRRKSVKAYVCRSESE